MGSREFDPKYVGYATTPFDGAFEYFTDQPGDPHPGNSNAGHEFRDGHGMGVEFGRNSANKSDGS